MGPFLAAAAGFPTAIFTVLLGIAVVYWLLALVGLVDAGLHSDGADLGAELHADGDADDPGTLAAIAGTLGLAGLPVSVVVSAVVLVAWTLCCVGALLLLPLLPAGGAQVAGGAVLGLASLSAALPVAGWVLRPLRPLFVTHLAQHNASLVGQSCKVLTQTVDEQVGRAEVAQRGANLNIRVWAPSPNALTRGTRARIVAYEDARARYRIEPEA